MCGIIGVVGKQDASPLIVDGLKRLEYRGYDSAGVATLDQGSIKCVKAEGKLSSLIESLKTTPLKGTIGIGHTRWATHGAPSVKNAHPHSTDKVAVVHNGIIENFKELKDTLKAKGCEFVSDTDTEVIPHLITTYLKEGKTPKEAVFNTLKQLKGAFALGIIFHGEENLLIGARKGSPLVIGHGNGAMYLGSDAYALSPLTSKLTYLEEGDVAILNDNQAIIYDEQEKPVQRNIHLSSLSGDSTGKGEYRHYMLKEIHQQPEVIAKTLSAYYNHVTDTVTLPTLPFDLKATSKITVVACGTSYYAGLVAKYWFEQIAQIPVEIDIASEFRYRNAVMPKDGVALFISQSGETADTLAALRFAKQQGQHIISIVNAHESTMERESDAVLHTHAGAEIGVASTKAFVTQLTVLACLAIACGEAKGILPKERRKTLLSALSQLPQQVNSVLNQNQQIQDISRKLMNAQDILYIGRGTSYAVALEGALKLKELSYIHAEGIAAGELKHGPIALIDEKVPVIVIAPSDSLFEKTLSNVQEVVSRGGKVVFICDTEGKSGIQDNILSETILLPHVDPFVAPILYTVPVQLIAYHVAVLKGTDVDQPRNLAKSVTVE
jgi:glucosamine--fructose-6-phosphate aminotransferase (isomerizing)